MRSCILALAFAALSSASPTSVSSRSSDPCMCEEDAAKVAQNYANLIGQPFSHTLAKNTLTPTFVDHSDSVIELINAGCNGPLTLGKPTFTDRHDFIRSQGKQKPIPFQILNVWNNCDTVTMRWRSSGPGYVQPEQEVTGIIVLETSPNHDKSSDQAFKIHTVYSEFNSGAWLIDVGNVTASCSGTPYKDGAVVR